MVFALIIALLIVAWVVYLLTAALQRAQTEQLLQAHRSIDAIRDQTVQSLVDAARESGASQQDK